MPPLRLQPGPTFDFIFNLEDEPVNIVQQENQAFASRSKAMSSAYTAITIQSKKSTEVQGGDEAIAIAVDELTKMTLLSLTTLKRWASHTKVKPSRSVKLLELASFGHPTITTIFGIKHTNVLGKLESWSKPHSHYRSRGYVCDPCF